MNRSQNQSSAEILNDLTSDDIAVWETEDGKVRVARSEVDLHFEFDEDSAIVATHLAANAVYNHVK